MRALACVLFAALLLGAEPEAPSPEPAPEPSATESVEPTQPPTPASRATENPVPFVEPTVLLISDPYEILRRARAAFHAVPPPAYLVYNMDKNVFIDDQPDGYDSYLVRIWCRTSDAEALARLWYPPRHRAVGDLHFISPTMRFSNDPLPPFNSAELVRPFHFEVDPGPPTGDIYEPPPPATPAPRPVGTERLKTIAIVTRAGDLDYRATLVNVKRGRYHLRLQALRDEDRNRLRDIWVRTADFRTTDAIAARRARELFTGQIGAISLAMHFAYFGGLPLLDRAIEIVEVLPTLGSLGQRVEYDYRYDEMAFATTLPTWYFDPKTYRPMFHDAPSR